MNLKVIECYAVDAGRGIARIDRQSMSEIGSSAGGIIEVKAQRSTVAKCLPLYDKDEGRGIIRIDSFLRESVGVAMNEEISIRRVEFVPKAEKIALLALGPLPPLESSYIADCLENRAIAKGSILAIPYFGGRLTFEVVGIEPDSSLAVLITESTRCEIQRGKYF